MTNHVTNAHHDKIITTALAHWGFEGASVQLAAARENTVYAVDHDGARYALRLHRIGYRDDAELVSELQWMDGLTSAGMNLPRPVPSSAGQFIHTIDGVSVDILTWLDGRPMRLGGSMIDHPDITAIYYQLGQSMATLHHVSDEWTPPANFTRARWDADGLMGEDPQWGRFWENPHLSALQIKQMKAFQADALRRLQAHPEWDFGLIHADLVPDNVLIHHHNGQDKLYMIDFDDSGFGYRLFDLATTLHHAARTDNYDAYHHALLAGYQDRRALDLDGLRLFQAIRALSYVGWIIPRVHEDGGTDRTKRFIQEAMTWMDAV